MIYALIACNGKEQLCCVDKIGRRAFVTEEFFIRNLMELCIESNRAAKKPETMEDLIRGFNPDWSDDMALFFGSNPDLGISIDPENEWAPLVRLEEIWSPLETKRGRSLLAD
jgi:hypothetical protein